jgi:HAD superfamily hydrolase (TIGR01509 family)
LPIKAVLFDYIGTLVRPCSYSMERSKAKLHKALCDAGLNTNAEEFMVAYAKAHEKYRTVRYQQLKEVTNAIWVSEALCSAKCNVDVDDYRLKAALNVFFQDFIDSLKLRPYAKSTLTKASKRFRLGLISNFTYAPAIYASLRKLRIDSYFNAIVVSEDVGWRKPHRIIFKQALQMLHVKPQETVLIGDSPTEDIEGARSAGMQTVFLRSGFNTLEDLEKHAVKASKVFSSLKMFYDEFLSISC